MEQMNIIFIHKGNSWYLPYALNQVKKSNPNANIILLGDESNNKYPFIKHFLISDYSKAAGSFSLIYKHFSTTNYQHELFCIQRWFIWLEFMQAHNLNSVMLPDTDVLIFQDVTRYYENVEEDFHFTKGSTGYMGFVYIKKQFYLNQICQFITDQYSTASNLKKLDNKYNDWLLQHEIGGVSDITLFDEYEQVYPNCSFNFEISRVNGMVFINSLDSPYYKKDNNNYVDVKWVKGVPYATQLNGERVTIIGVHCFGLQKTYIRKLYKGKNWFAVRLVYFWKISVFKMIFDRIRGGR